MEDKKLTPIMFVGTGSDVGKSVIAAGFCRVFLQDGYAPAPFKSQNMSLNSFVTLEGGEIGRAQAVQAEACRIECHTDMNPVLLKPSSDKTSQVILNGRVFGNYQAGSYYRGIIKNDLFKEAMQAFDRLSQKYSPIVIEGAGSISELNLKNADIANMRVALETKATTILVADIERGGVFGSVYGSIELLGKEERERIKGIIINKFRGDIGLFREGREILEKLTGVPVLGVIPHFSHIHIEEEDSVSLQKKKNKASQGQINVSVIALSRISNFTDFNNLEKDSRVNLYYTKDKVELRKADIVIIPGSKNTIADLFELKEQGLAAEIGQLSHAGKTVIGICGGYQIMGEKIEDPHQVESSALSIEGLGLLPVVTVLQKEKQTVRSTFFYKDKKVPCQGYEIHMGKTLPTGKLSKLNLTEQGEADGYMLSPHCWGTYMHGILDNQVVIDDLLKPYSDQATETKNWQEQKDGQYDLLAAHIREHVDMGKVYKILRND